MAEIEDDIGALDVGIVWVLEADPSGQAGTAQSCYDFVSASGASTGWCVGDAETVPDPGEWDDSPFSVGRAKRSPPPPRPQRTSNAKTTTANEGARRGRISSPPWLRV